MIEVSLDDLRTVTDAKKHFLLIEHPKPEAREQGRQARREGVTRMSNPFPILSPSWASWDAGWNEATR